MRIGVFSHNYPRFAGDFSGHFVHSLCREWMLCGHQVDVFLPFDMAYRRPLRESTGPGSIALHLYRYIWPPQWHVVGYGRSMQADLQLRLNGYLLSPLLLAAGIAAALRQCRRNRPDVLHAHWVLPNGLIAAVVSRLLGIPLVVSIPGSDAQIAASNALFRAMARFTFQQAGVITADGADLRDAVAPLGADEAKFDLIVYATDPDTIYPDLTGTAELRASLGIGPQEVMVLAVGRLVPKKGFKFLLQALAEPALRQRPVTVVVVGSGDELAELRRLSHDLGLEERIRWVGTVPYNQLGVYYNACDLLAMPSVIEPAHGLNVCVLDAMSCGKPVVGSDVGGNPLAIVDGETGILVPERNPQALAQAIALLVDQPSLRTQMGLLGRLRVGAELSWPVLAQRYLAHFEGLIANTQSI